MQENQETSVTQESLRLKNFPISFFAMVMGLGGLTIATQKIAHIMNLELYYLNLGLLLFTGALFAFLLLVYLTKFIKYKEALIWEFNHPIRLNFFPTISISFILMAIASLKYSPATAEVFWVIGSVLHLILLLTIVSMWIQQTKFDIKHNNPAWFIPAVGNILVPIAGVKLGYMQISWFFFSIGIIFWIVLLAIFFNRIIFHNPLPQKLMPTLFILIAPPAVGFISYFQLTGSFDAFAKILYFFGVFMFLLLIVQFRLFNKIKFFLSWWAYSFPIAALTISTVLVFEITQYAFYKYLALGLISLLTLLILVLLTKTLKEIGQKNICVEED